MYPNEEENPKKKLLSVTIANSYQSLEQKDSMFNLKQEMDALYFLETNIRNRKLPVHEVINKIIEYIAKSIEIISNNQDFLENRSRLSIHTQSLQKKHEQLKQFQNEMINETPIGFEPSHIIIDISNSITSCKKYTENDNEEISRYLEYLSSFLSISNSFLNSVHPKHTPPYDQLTGNQFNMATFFQDKQNKEKYSCTTCVII